MWEDIKSSVCFFCAMPGAACEMPRADDAPAIWLHQYQCQTIQAINEQTGKIAHTNQSAACKEIARLKELVPPESGPFDYVPKDDDADIPF